MTYWSCLLKKNNLYSPMVWQPSTADIPFRKRHPDRNTHSVFTLSESKGPDNASFFNVLFPVISHVVGVSLRCFNIPS